MIKRLARYILRDELDAVRWQAVIDADANAASVLESLARVQRGQSKEVLIRGAYDLADWEENRR